MSLKFKPSLKNHSYFVLQTGKLTSLSGFYPFYAKNMNKIIFSVNVSVTGIKNGRMEQ